MTSQFIARQSARAAFAAAFAIASGAAMAQEAWMVIDSAKSRAEVVAALTLARQDGSMQVFNEGYVETLQPTKTTRAQVVAELLAARARGEVF